MICDIDGCNLVTYENNKCILHSDDKNKDIKKFWQEIRKQVKKKNDLEDLLETSINFKNIFFPKFEKKGLAESYSDNGDNFFYQNDKKEFNKIFKLECCTFFDEADFQYIKFKKGLSLENCIFEKGLNFENNIFQKKAKVRIQNCPNIVNPNFQNTTFKDLADFYNSIFAGNINFEKTNFQNISVFTKVTFKEDVNFKYTTFEELAQFKETIFENKLNLEDSIIKEEINFLNIRTSKNNIKAENIENRETARIIKNSFEKQDNIIEANKFYALEMEKREEELFLKKYFFEWSVFKLHKISSNHSQDWFLVLLWILNISYIYSFIKANTFYYIDTLIGFTFILFIFIFSYSFLIKFKNNLGKIGLSILSLLWLIYSPIKIDEVTNLISPFSIMTKGENLTFISLLYKSIIAYLIYQFIISIRQNTRRK